jgi:GrpB-like predicted nucleotidyltransferase (UPF0157 family)
MPEPISIVSYDDRWPHLYEKERNKILRAVGHKLIALEHIGSTAVPGLCSKSIIDLLAAVGSNSDFKGCIEPLRNLGYEYYYYPEFPERCAFLDGSVGAGPHHLHMTQFGSEFWRDKLLFRDYLRRHPNVAQEYGRLKHAWAAEFGKDRDKYEDYTNAKTEFIEQALARARLEG